MKYADYLTALDKHIASHPLKLGDGESVLTLLYESYEELQGCSSGQIKEDFHELYRLLNGMSLTELDKIGECLGILPKKAHRFCNKMSNGTCNVRKSCV